MKRFSEQGDNSKSKDPKHPTPLREHLPWQLAILGVVSRSGHPLGSGKTPSRLGGCMFGLVLATKRKAKSSEFHPSIDSDMSVCAEKGP